MVHYVVGVDLRLRTHKRSLIGDLADAIIASVVHAKPLSRCARACVGDGAVEVVAD